MIYPILLDSYSSIRYLKINVVNHVYHPIFNSQNDLAFLSKLLRIQKQIQQYSLQSFFICNQLRIYSFDIIIDLKLNF